MEGKKKKQGKKKRVDTRIIAIINQKGGVGKTTTAINLSSALAHANHKILLIDFDPQGNTTSGLGIDKRSLNQCVYDMILNGADPKSVLIKNVYANLDVIPATIDLAGAEVELVTQISRETRLKDAIEPLVGKYEYIIIDCPPSLGLLTINSLVAANGLIIPIQSEFYALEGVTKLLESMKLVKDRLNKDLEIYGVLITMFDGRTTIARQVADEVKNYFGDLVFETVVPRSVKLSEAPSYGEPINVYHPTGKGAKAYDELAEEVIERG